MQKLNALHSMMYILSIGSIDIRNSSTERSHSIQADIIEQLELALRVVKKAQADMPFPLLQEIEFKIEKHHCCCIRCPAVR